MQLVALDEFELRRIRQRLYAEAAADEIRIAKNGCFFNLVRKCLIRRRAGWKMEEKLKNLCVGCKI